MQYSNDVIVWFNSKFHLNLTFHFETEKGILITKYIPNNLHEGYPLHLHGGILASIFDESQAVVCQEYGYLVMTKELTIRYLKKIPLQLDRIEIKSYLTKVQKKALYTKAIVYSPKNPDTIFAEARGSWYVLPLQLIKRQNMKDSEKITDYLTQRKNRSKEIRRSRINKKTLNYLQYLN